MAQEVKTGGDIVASDFTFLVGCVLPWAGRAAPDAKWFVCDGSAVSRTTYADLFAVLVPTIDTFTVTIASPGVFTLNSHGLVAGDAVYLTTSGALPTGLTANTIYYVIATGLTTNTFQLSTTRGGTGINTSGSQSGTHTLKFCPYGLGDGSTTFNIPDLRQRVPVGYKTADTVSGYMGQNGGEQTHTLIKNEMPSHDHGMNGRHKWAPSGGGPNTSFQAGNFQYFDGTAFSEGGDQPHNNMQPYITMNYIIRGKF